MIAQLPYSKCLTSYVSQASLSCIKTSVPFHSNSLACCLYNCWISFGLIPGLQTLILAIFCWLCFLKLFLHQLTYLTYFCCCYISLPDVYCCPEVAHPYSYISMLNVMCEVFHPYSYIHIFFDCILNGCVAKCPSSIFMYIHVYWLCLTLLLCDLFEFIYFGACLGEGRVKISCSH